MKKKILAMIVSSICFSVNNANALTSIDLQKKEKDVLTQVVQKTGIHGHWIEYNNSAIANNVMADNHLVQLNQMNYGKVYFPVIKAKNTIQYDEHDPKNIQIKYSNSLSSTRMRNGIPAIGSDGQAVQLCRLINDSNATFFEVSKTNSYNFVKYSGSGMSMQDACISYPGTLNRYWKKRYLDFFDNNGVPINIGQ